MWHRLCEEMSKAGLKPASWGYFWKLTSTKEYELLTVDNCCCGTCRELGFENYEELREMVGVLDQELMSASNNTVGFDKKKDFLDRIEKEEGFRRCLFARHLESESSCGSHCLTMLLSSHVDPRFRKPCSHPGAEGCGERLRGTTTEKQEQETGTMIAR